MTKLTTSILISNLVIAPTYKNAVDKSKQKKFKRLEANQPEHQNVVQETIAYSLMTTMYNLF